MLLKLPRGKKTPEVRKEKCSLLSCSLHPLQRHPPEVPTLTSLPWAGLRAFIWLPWHPQLGWDWNREAAWRPMAGWCAHRSPFHRPSARGPETKGSSVRLTQGFAGLFFSTFQDRKSIGQTQTACDSEVKYFHPCRSGLASR